MTDSPEPIVEDPVFVPADEDDWNEENSNLMKHAKKELSLINADEWITNGALKIVETFARMGHSGGSAYSFIPMIEQLFSFKPLSPLTDDPDEWIQHGEDIWQNTRDGEAFSNDGGKTYYLLSDEYDYNTDTRPIYNSRHRDPETGELENVMPEEMVYSQDDVEEDPIIELDWTQFPIDSKYGWVLTERGDFETNEPVFIFRAKDKLLPDVLSLYFDLCVDAGSPGRHLDGIERAIERIVKWQKDHETKVPDSENSRNWLP